jgi:hypothetical protein
MYTLAAGLIMGGLSYLGARKQAEEIEDASKRTEKIAKDERDRVDTETAKQKALIKAQSERIMANSTRQQQYQSMLLNELEGEDDTLFGFGKNNNPFSNNYM